jgi:hypothetical protein
MKNFRTKILILLILSIWAVNPVFSVDLDALQSGLNKFTDSMKQALPFNSTMGLNWSDGYIGQITNLPPRFGIGVSGGFTTMNSDSINNLLNSFNLPVDNSLLYEFGLPIPGIILEGRIGGIKFPFDIGLKLGYIPPDIIKTFVDDFDFSYDYMLLGIDLRYSLINRKIFIPKLSVGIGINYMQGGIGAPLPVEDLSYDFFDSANNKKYKLSFSDEGQFKLDWRTICAELKVQASFPFKFITPYAGAGISCAWSQANYKVTTPKLLVEGGSLDDITKILLDQLNIKSTDEGFGTENKFIWGLSTRAFGGISINIAFFRIDITGMYEFIGGYLGGTLGMRFQL